MSNEDLSKLTINKNTSEARRRPGRKKAVVVASVAIGIALAFFFGRAAFTPSVAVETVAVSQVYPFQSFAVLNASGYVVAQRKAAVSSKITGRIDSIAVEEGSRILKGDVVARLEAEDLKAAKGRAEANLRTSKANLDAAKTEQSDASTNLRRSRELLEKGYISRLDFDSAHARAGKSDAAVAASEASVKASEQAFREAEIALEYANLRAPFDAVVLTKNADIGDIITPLGAAANAKAAVITIADMSSLQVEVDVSESNIGLVKVGMPCEIRLDALQEKGFRGEVHMIVPTADRTKATILVKIRFIDHDRRVLPEISAKVTFLGKKPSEDDLRPRPAVRAESLVDRDGKTFLYVVRAGRAAEVEVRTGGRFGDMVELMADIKTDEKIIRKPPAGVRDGTKVKTSDR